jgi:hypothetical protein
MPKPADKLTFDMFEQAASAPMAAEAQSPQPSNEPAHDAEAERAIKRLIRQARSKNLEDEDEAIELIRHPDTRVMRALLTSPKKPWNEHGWSGRFYDEALLRGKELAAVPGAPPWNMELATCKMVVGKMEYSVARSRTGALYEIRNQAINALKDMDADGLLRMLDTAPETMDGAIAGRATKIDLRVARRLMSSHSAMMARNPHVPTEVRNEIADWAVDVLTQGMATTGSGDWRELERVSKDAFSCLYNLSRLNDYSLGENRIRTLVEASRGKATTGIGASARWWSAQIVARALHDVPADLDDDTMTLVSRCRWSLETGVSNKEVRPELLRRIALQTRSSRVRKALAKNESAMQDPEIAKRFSKSNVTAIVEAVAENSEGKTFRNAFKKLIEKKTAKAIEVLEKRIDEVGDTVEATDLAPGFNHPDVNVRAKVFGQVHKVGPRRGQ